MHIQNIMCCCCACVDGGQEGTCVYACVCAHVWVGGWVAGVGWGSKEHQNHYIKFNMVPVSTYL